MNRAALISTNVAVLASNNELFAFVKDIFGLHSRGAASNYFFSSVWAGFKSSLIVISDRLCWWVGSGTKVDFWHDQWLGGALVDLIHLPVYVAGKFKAKVSDFLINGVWCLSNSFKHV